MAQTITTTTDTKTTATQLGTQLVVDSVSNTQTVGTFVTGVTLQPYIASRIISFIAYNMRPSQRMHIFFDGVMVDKYCAPAVKTNDLYSTSVADTSNENSIPKDGNWGDPIFSDKNGIVAGQFNLPASTFKTGERIFQITDVDNLVLGSDAFTTMSSAKFTASNLNVTTETITLTTVNPELNFIPIKNEVVTYSQNVVVKTTPDKIRFTVDVWEPIAQALTINTSGNESGIFATSLDIFFKQKPVSNVNGITVYLSEMNNGYPDGSRILPLSTVHLNHDEVLVSNNATVKTRFVFESPVFMANKNEYAFIVKPDSNDPDYQVWSANLGDLDVNSGYQVYSQPLIGTAFYGATTKQWTALQTEYIKFILNRASFKNSVGISSFNNSNTDYIKIYNVEYTNSSVSILPGDYIFESQNSVINSSSGSVNTSVYGVVEYFDDVKGIVYTQNSTGNFFQNTDEYVQIHRFNNTSVTIPTNLTRIAHANSGSLVDLGVNLLVPQLATISPPGTSINYTYTGTSNSALSYELDANEVRVTPGIETEFLDKERVVASRSNEVAEMLGEKSFTLKAQLTTDSEFVSPVIDTVRNQQLVIQNDVDPISFDYNEFFTNGSAKSKYISKVVTLAPGQDAEDIQVALTAFRPVGSDIQVWVKFLNGEDTESIARKTWTPLYNTTPNLYSDPSNPRDFREFVFSVGSYYTMFQLQGTSTANNTNTTINGVNTKYEVDLEKGWYINMRASQQPVLNAVPLTVVANTLGVNNSANTIKVDNDGNNGTTPILEVGDRVRYVVPAGNTAIPNLTANTYYYVTFANASDIALSTSNTGSNVNIEAVITTAGQSHSIRREELSILQEQTRKVISIASNTSLTIDSPFVGNYNSNLMFLVPPPTTAWLSDDTKTKLTGTVTVSTTDNVILGSGTQFDLDLKAGNIIEVANDSQVIVSISNSSHLTVGTPWSSSVSGANAYVVAPLGVTYLNENLNLYSGFKQFQIKIILQSDDSSKVPILDDLRVLALQL